MFPWGVYWERIFHHPATQSRRMKETCAFSNFQRWLANQMGDIFVISENEHFSTQNHFYIILLGGLEHLL
jgi:hypothetical protein